eukprot:4391902-Pleurochrysis_carterae.AAC.1
MESSAQRQHCCAAPAAVFAVVRCRTRSAHRASTMHVCLHVLVSCIGFSFWVLDGGGAGALGILSRGQGWSDSPKPDHVRSGCSAMIAERRSAVCR